MEELEKVGEYQKQQDGRINRMIPGDSLLVMTIVLKPYMDIPDHADPLFLDLI